MSNLKLEDFSPTQQRVIRYVKAALNQQAELGGHCRLPILSAARALVRRGILVEWRSSTFSPKDEKSEIWK